jgi:hypothetical protein
MRVNGDRDSTNRGLPEHYRTPILEKATKTICSGSAIQSVGIKCIGLSHMFRKGAASSYVSVHL